MALVPRNSNQNDTVHMLLAAARTPAGQRVLSLARNALEDWWNRPAPTKQQKRKVEDGMKAAVIPAANVSSFVQRRPRIKAGRRAAGTVVISHTERMARIVSAGGTDEFTSGLLQPGDMSMFPWLANLAHSFEQYRIRKFIIRYTPLVGTTTSGAVGIAWDPDPSDSAPTFADDFYSNRYMATGPPFSPLRLVIPQSKWLFTRGLASAPSSQDRKFFDYGSVITYVSNVAAGAAGEVFLDYEVELKNPQGAECPSSWTTSSSSSLSGSDYFMRHFSASEGSVAHNITSSSFQVYGPSAYLVTCELTGTGLVQVNSWLTTSATGATVELARGSASGGGTLLVCQALISATAKGLSTFTVVAQTATTVTLSRCFIAVYDLNYALTWS